MISFCIKAPSTKPLWEDLSSSGVHSTANFVRTSARGEENEDSAKVRGYCSSHDRQERASKDRSTSRVGSTQAWMTALSITDSIPNRTFNVVVFNQRNALLSLANHQRTISALSPPSVTVHNEFDNSTTYISNPPKCESVNLVSHQLHVERLQQMANDE